MRVAAGGWIASSQYGLPPCRLSRPKTVDAAVSALAAAPETPTVLCGGTDLVARIREGTAPRILIDIAGIAALKTIRIADGQLELGAAVTHEAGAASPAVREAVAGLSEAWSRLANVRVRNRATLGGNLMARRTRYEGALLFSALSARMHFIGPSGGFDLPVEAIWNADLPPTALLTHLTVPLAGNPVLSYDRRFRPQMTLAVAVRDTGSPGCESRAVIGTEWLEPAILPLPAAGQGDPADVAAAAFARLPESFGDVASPRVWLDRAGRVLLARQLEQLGSRS